MKRFRAKLGQIQDRSGPQDTMSKIPNHRNFWPEVVYKDAGKGSNPYQNPRDLPISEVFLWALEKTGVARFRPGVSVPRELLGAKCSAAVEASTLKH